MLCYTYNKETPKTPILIIMAPTLPSSRHICNQEAERKHTCKSGTVGVPDSYIFYQAFPGQVKGRPSARCGRVLRKSALSATKNPRVLGHRTDPYLQC